MKLLQRKTKKLQCILCLLEDLKSIYVQQYELHVPYIWLSYIASTYSNLKELPEKFNKVIISYKYCTSITIM